MSRIFVVLNPNSGKGRGRKLEPRVRAAFASQDAEFGLTEQVGDEERLARRAIENGFDRIVAVGGDGTWSNVGHVIVESGRPVALGLVPGGTGCDLARSIGIPQNDLTACAAIVARGSRRAIDVGRLEQRHFLNVAGFGFDIAVLEHSWRVKWLRGEPLYLYCALAQMKAYPGFQLKSSLDGAPGPSGRHMMIIVANAKKFGGGFPVAPDARLDDGELDIVTFGDLGFFGRLQAMGALIKGRHNALPQIGTRRAKRTVLEFDAPPAFETDGEWRQAKSATITIDVAPRALNVLVP